MGLWEEEPDKMPRSFWQKRFYDFNVWSRKKRIEKLEYMHRNPVKRGLVADAKQWSWSSYRFYQYGEESVCTPNPEPGRSWRNEIRQGDTRPRTPANTAGMGHP
jgi:hypothetical protein